MEQFERLGMALAIGLLVGVERGWNARDEAEGSRTAGLRTYTLVGLLGGVAALLGQALGGWAFAAVAVPVAAALILFKLREQEADKDYSVTALVAALMVFALGAYVCVGDWRVATAAAVVTSALLALKDLLHGWMRQITWPEIRSGLVLLAMSFVALPLLPDKAFGPYGAFNPYQLGLMTIGLAGVSFLAYGAVKIWGETKGLVLAAAAGALVSSTAVTLYLARREREVGTGLTAYVGAALLAGAVMTVRIFAIMAVVAPVLLAHAGPAVGAFAAVSAVLGLAAVTRGKVEGGAPPMKSPFDLGVVLKFAAVLGLVMAAAKVLSGMYGAAGLFTLAAVAGLADVDAVTLTASELATKGLAPQTAACAILIAAAVDTASKTVITMVAAGPRFAALFGSGSLLAALAAGGVLWFTA